MWWKITLYALLVVVLGIGITTLSGSIAFNALASSSVAEAVAQGNYTLAESFFNYVSVRDSWKFSSIEKEGVRCEVYPCLVKQPYFYNFGDGRYSTKYDIIEEAIAISFYHLPSDFAYRDAEAKAQIALSLSNETVYRIYLNNDVEEDTAPNYHIDFSSYVDQYKGLTVYATYDDFISNGGALNDDIVGVTLYDGKGQKALEIELSEKANFRSSFAGLYHTACQDYRAFMLEYGEYNSVTGLQRKKELIASIDSITNDHPEVLVARPSTTIILADTRFLLTISITLAAYASIAIVVSKAIFGRKRKRK